MGGFKLVDWTPIQTVNLGEKRKEKKKRRDGIFVTGAWELLSVLWSVERRDPPRKQWTSISLSLAWVDEKLVWGL